jgi:hypothetical protein
MLQLPEPWPDETFYSLLARIALMNGSINHVELVRTLLGEKRATSVIGARVNLSHFCDITRNMYGSPREVLQSLSALVARARLGELDGSTLAAIECGALTPSMTDLVSGENGYWRMCEKCEEYDVKTYGIAYWHQTHQLPTSYYCLEHGLPLEEWKLGRARLHNDFLLPHDLDRTQRDGVRAPSGRNRVWLNVAQLGINALADTEKPLSQITIYQATLSGLRDRGFLSRLGQVRMSSFKEGFEREYGSEMSGTGQPDIGPLRNSKQLFFGITDGRACKPFGRLLLVQWLFGNWNAFKERCRWQDVLDQGLRRSRGSEEANPLGGRHPAEGTAAIERYRQACLDYKASYPNPSRLQFLKVSYRAFRWLRQNDQVWLDQQLPLPPRHDGQYELFG